MFRMFNQTPPVNSVSEETFGTMLRSGDAANINGKLRGYIQAMIGNSSADNIDKIFFKMMDPDYRTRPSMEAAFREFAQQSNER